MQYKSNNNVVYSCKYHIIWCPKYRRKVLVGDVEIRLKELIYEIAQELKVEIIEGESDEYRPPCHHHRRQLHCHQPGPRLLRSPGFPVVHAFCRPSPVARRLFLFLLVGKNLEPHWQSALSCLQLTVAVRLAARFSRDNRRP